MCKPITFAAAFIIAATITITGQPLNNAALNPNSASKRVEPLEGSEAAKALTRLGSLTSAAIRARLKQMRQPAYSAGPLLVAKIIEAQQLPIASSKQIDLFKVVLQPVLDYHERGQMQIIVVYSDKPKAILVDRVAIVITSKLRLIFSDAEIRGIIAHELAHEYIWAEHKKAQLAKDGKLMRECELFCDAVAAFTLKEIGENPASYTRVLARMALIGAAAGEAGGQESDTHPSLDARINLNKFLCQRLISCHRSSCRKSHGLSPMRRNKAVKRGSMRRLSKIGFTPRKPSPLRSTYAFSSQANACSFSPSPT